MKEKSVRGRVISFNGKGNSQLGGWGVEDIVSGKCNLSLFSSYFEVPL